jgi:hypothetical protein
MKRFKKTKTTKKKKKIVTKHYFTLHTHTHIKSAYTISITHTVTHLLSCHRLHYIVMYLIAHTHTHTFAFNKPSYKSISNYWSYFVRTGIVHYVCVFYFNLNSNKDIRFTQCTWSNCSCLYVSLFNRVIQKQFIQMHFNYTICIHRNKHLFCNVRW